MNFKKIFLLILSLFILVSTVSASDTFYKNGKWITHTQDCQNFFHDSHMIGTEGAIKGTSTCSCESNYKLNSTGNKCVRKEGTWTPTFSKTSTEAPFLAATIPAIIPAGPPNY